MKRRWILLAMLLAAIAALGAGMLFSQDGDTLVPLEEMAFSGDRDILRAELTYDAGTRTLRGKQHMTIVNRTGAPLSDIVLRLYMNARNEEAIAVSSAAIDGQPVSFEQDDPTVLRIAHDWEADKAVTLSFTLMIKHEKGDNVITLPSLSVYEDGAWRTDAYDALVDPGYAQAFDYAAKVDGEIAAQMAGARDASFVLPGQGAAREAEMDGVRVRALAQSGANAQKLLTGARQALESLHAVGLAYPYEMLTIAESETGREDGMAYSGLIALSMDGDEEALRRRITRLIARQTFGVYVESDPWNAPWLSVSLASAAELMAYRALKGEDAYQTRFFDEIEVATRLTRPAGVTVGAGTAHFGSDSEMTQVLRDQGAAMLLGIEQAVGEERFIAALQLYIARCGGKIAVQADLEAALAEATGSAWDGYFADELRW